MPYYIFSVTKFLQFTIVATLIFSFELHQGEQLVVANVGDSRAVLATISEDGNLVPHQLTVDFKPNLPR